jgi:hypothetical protein
MRWKGLEGLSGRDCLFLASSFDLFSVTLSSRFPTCQRGVIRFSAEATRAETGRYASRNPYTPNFATFSGRKKYDKTQMRTKWSDDGERRLNVVQLWC